MPIRARNTANTIRPNAEMVAPGTKTADELKKAEREKRKGIGDGVEKALRTENKTADGVDQTDRLETTDIAHPFASAPGARGTHSIGQTDSATVRFAQSRIDVHPSWSETALEGAMSGGQLDLNKVNPTMFLALDPNQRKTLMTMLAHTELPVERRDQAGNLQTPGDAKIARGFNKLSLQVFGKSPQKTTTENSAEAMGRKMWASGDSKAFAAAWAAAPSSVMPMVDGDAANVLCMGQLMHVLIELKGSENDGARIEPRDLDALGNLFARYMEVNTRGEDASLDAAVQQLMGGVNQAGLLETGPKTVGMITGAMLAGMKKYCDKMGQGDVKKKLIVTNMANNVWAASGWAAFAGGLPAGLIGAAVAQAAVAGATWYSSKPPELPSDEFVNRARGDLEIALLEGAENMKSPHEGKDGTQLPGSWKEHEGGYSGAVRTMNEWMSATLHSNGVS